jgi:flagellar export protein FliJ
MSLQDAVRHLELAIRQAADAERQAAERLRAARTRLSDAEQRLDAVQAYAREYQGRHRPRGELKAGSMQDEQRFLLQLEHTVALQTRVAEQDRYHVDQAELRWVAARRKRQAIEVLRDERATSLARRREAQEQQRLDDRPRSPDSLGGLGG